jgi:hypothetical protein
MGEEPDKTIVRATGVEAAVAKLAAHLVATSSIVEIETAIARWRKIEPWFLKLLQAQCHPDGESWPALTSPVAGLHGRLETFVSASALTTPMKRSSGDTRRCCVIGPWRWMSLGTVLVSG